MSRYIELAIQSLVEKGHVILPLDREGDRFYEINGKLLTTPEAMTELGREVHRLQELAKAAARVFPFGDRRDGRPWTAQEDTFIGLSFQAMLMGGIACVAVISVAALVYILR